MTKLQLVDAIGKEMESFLKRSGQKRITFYEKIGLTASTTRLFMNPMKGSKSLPGLFAIEKILNYFGYTISFAIKPTNNRTRKLWNNGKKLYFEEELK